MSEYKPSENTVPYNVAPRQRTINFVVSLLVSGIWRPVRECVCVCVYVCMCVCVCVSACVLGPKGYEETESCRILATNCTGHQKPRNGPDVFHRYQFCRPLFERI